MKFISIFLTVFALNTCESKENLTAKNNLQEVTLSGTYTISVIGKDKVSNNLTIVFDEATKNLSGFSGCNRYFGSYTVDIDVLNIGPIASTKKYCIGEATAIENVYQKALGNVNRFKIENSTLFLLNNDEVLITANKGNTNETKEYYIKYTAISRGFYKTVEFKNDSILYQNNRTEKPGTVKCSSQDLEKLNQLIHKLDLSALSNLEPPTKAHEYDGAAGAILIIEHSAKTFETMTFDHGNPPQEISELVNLILALSESI